LSLPAGPTLDGVVLKGSLDLGDPAKAAAIRDGLTVTTSAGGQPGTINLSGGQLTVLDTETLDNVAISLGAPGTPANPVAYSLWDGNTGTALTLGRNAVTTALAMPASVSAALPIWDLDAIGATQQQWLGQTIVNAGRGDLGGGGLSLSGIAVSKQQR